MKSEKNHLTISVQIGLLLLILIKIERYWLLVSVRREKDRSVLQVALDCLQTTLLYKKHIGQRYASCLSI